MDTVIVILSCVGAMTLALNVYTMARVLHHELSYPLPAESRRGYLEIAARGVGLVFFMSAVVLLRLIKEEL